MSPTGSCLSFAIDKKTKDNTIADTGHTFDSKSEDYIYHFNVVGRRKIAPMIV